LREKKAVSLIGMVGFASQLRLNAFVVSIEIPSTVEPKMADKIIIIIIKAK
jgi:hypothetical protein